MKQHLDKIQEAPPPAPSSAAQMRIGYGNLLFILISLFILFSSFSFLSKLQQIPSPIYGGDYYNGLGGVIHIVDGGNLLDSAQMLGQVPWVPWLYHLSVAIFSKLAGLAPMQALIDFALIIDLLSLAAVYLIAREFSTNKYLPAILALVYFSLGHHPAFKYSSFAFLVVLPFFALSLYQFLKEPDVKKALISGVLLGLVGLSNSQSFFMGFLLLGCGGLLFLLPQLVDFKPFKPKLDAPKKELLKLWGILFAIGFAISLLFWFRPLFIYQGSTPNDIQNITIPDMTQPAVLWSTIQGYVTLMILPFQSGFLWLFSLVSIAGIYYAYKHRTEIEGKFALAVLLCWFLAIVHPLITLPLFHLQLVNFMMSDQIYPLAVLVLLSLGSTQILQKAEKRGAKLPYILLGILLAAAFFSYTGYMGVRNSDQWSKVGMTPIAPAFTELSDWIRQNTDVNDVFLTDNEDAFAMNAVSGRKVVSYRRTHASPYINVNERMADAAVMAYGTNDAARVALLEKYNVKYLLWSYRWVQNEFSFDSTGQLAGFFDPLAVPASQQSAAYWDSNGVKYIQFSFPMDPAPRTGVPVYDQLVALPYELSNEPLSPGLYSHFDLVKTVSQDGQEIFRIYQIKE